MKTCARNYYVRTIVGTLVRFEVGLCRLLMYIRGPRELRKRKSGQKVAEFKTIFWVNNMIFQKSENGYAQILSLAKDV